MDRGLLLGVLLASIPDFIRLDQTTKRAINDKNFKVFREDRLNLTMKVVLVSGGFDPIHSGHMAYLKEAKSMGDRLIVALNSDDWLKNKKGKFFMPFKERKIILSNIRFVDEVIAFEDDEAGSCKNALEKVKLDHPNDEILFCNGGDRNKQNIPEMEVKGVSFHFGGGGKDKKNSASWIHKKF